MASFDLGAGRVRKRLEGREELLSPYASKSRLSRGRDAPEEPCPLRTDFQRDRDRIIHTNAFRRLKHKTQVFVAPPGDHYVTRLTHTLEVAQIARTISRALNLNEDLTEAISLGHDLGHTPFGHIGEQVLDGLYPEGFRHSLQSLRVVERLEKGGRGLNLTPEVRQGIVAHSKPRGDFLRNDDIDAGVLSLETQVCRISDAIAYVNHDIGDAIRAGMLNEEALPKVACETLGTRHGQRIDTLVKDVVSASWVCTGEAPITLSEKPVISMSHQISEAMVVLREFLFEAVYLPAGQGAEGRVARNVVEFLYAHFCAHPNDIPADYWARQDPPERMAVDYIAGMTDNYALMVAEQFRPGISGDVFRWRL